ncbi:2,3,4,5-tetrahydropyridine-2,6-dicarboxylate N-succinyltransferase [Buchnera aphidicola (Neophyllaphis varicolor)]|uniref:2,3,4,5-tetrahydropyridine-2,6-dicarboxylate N-succinyltransferase n=1 Tax=Buchnera aphidicola TaxID=9 RepID=UPI0031B8560F
MIELKKNIEHQFKNIENINTKSIKNIDKEKIYKVISLLNSGIIRVSEKNKGIWTTNEWIKKAILLYFKIKKNKVMKGSDNLFFDKIPLKFNKYNKEKFIEEEIRIVPPATARFGSFIGKKSILMPSYVNIGAYIDEGSMIDTWATIGSCAQIGKNVHISGGVGIGGVLEPLQSNPTIIEDNCFIGARSEIVEGVIIKKGSVISMGVYIGKSTKIYDREDKKIYYGIVPSGSVVVPGNIPSKNNEYSLYSAIIVKKVDLKTLSKVGINKLLRSID